MSLLNLLFGKKTNATVKRVDYAVLGKFPDEPKRISYDMRKKNEVSIVTIIIATLIDPDGKLIKSYMPVSQNVVKEGDIVSKVARIGEVYRRKDTKIHYHKILAFKSGSNQNEW
jgi:hypothetical protein